MNNDQLSQRSQTMPVKSIHDPREWDRVLKIYGGIFKNEVATFAKVILPRLKAKKNYSR